MRTAFFAILTGVTALGYEAVAQPKELKIISRGEDGWNAGGPITTRTKAQALKMLEDKGKTKTDADMLNVEEQMPKRLSPIYLTIHHTYDPLPRVAVPKNRTLKAGDYFKMQMLQWQKSMQGGYDVDGRKYKGQPYTLFAFPGDVPYHFVVSKAGEVAVGRQLEFGVFSNTTYLDRPRKDMTPAERSALEADRTDPRLAPPFWRNEHMPRHITVVLEGDFGKTKLVGNQRKNLVTLLVTLSKEHNIPPDRLTFHRDMAKEGTGCPGQNVIDEMPKLRSEVAKRLK